MKRSDVMSQPPAMKTDRYIGMGLAYVDGNDAWNLMRACVDGDLERVESLVKGDPNLANVQYWYQIPLHYAVREGHVEVVRLLLEHGADPATSCFGDDSWAKLLAAAELRGLTEVAAILSSEMARRFGYSPDFEPVAEAIRAYDVARVERLLDEQPRLLAASDGHGNGAVHWAVLTHQSELFASLRARGADFDAQRSDGRTPALVAIHGDYHYRWWRDVPEDRRRQPQELLAALLAQGAARSLSVAICQGDTAYVRRLLDARPSRAETLDSGHTSPLCYASFGGRPEMTELLLSYGPDPNQPETLAPRGRALFEAAARNNLQQAELLLVAGADPNAEVDSSGNSLSIVVFRHPQDHERMQELLQQHGAQWASWQMSTEELAAALEAGEIDAKEFLSADLLEKADLGLIGRLLERDPDFAKKLDGWSFRASSARLIDCREVLPRLLEHDFDVHRGDWLGTTLLHYCAEFGDVERAAWCLDHGADVDAVELQHRGTPLGAAARCGQLEVARLLMARGADLAIPHGATWATPLEQARRAGHEDLVSLLARAET